LQPQVQFPLELPQLLQLLLQLLLQELQNIINFLSPRGELYAAALRGGQRRGIIRAIL